MYCCVDVLKKISKYRWYQPTGLEDNALENYKIGTMAYLSLNVNMSHGVQHTVGHFR